MKGIFGRYLDVNLTTEKISDYELPEEWYKKYLGGRGIGLKILLEELKGDEDPLGPDNILIFATGPLQGTKFVGAGKHAVVSKSPKTGSLNDSYAGGFFGHELGTSGYDGIIIRGKAVKPKYISIMNGKCDIHDATSLWGMDVGHTDETIKQKHRGVRVACIGPAGENLVKFSCIMNDVNRAAGRPGFGAVMGSKNLKAIVVKGGIDKPIYNKEILLEARKKLAKDLMDNPDVKEFGKWGTPASIGFLNKEGILPTKNFQEGVFDGIDKINGKGEYYKDILTGRNTCTGCPIRCKRIVKSEFGGINIEEKYGGPEYETIAAFGPNCLNDDIRAISLAGQMCNQYGLDTISTGATIAFAMEASEKGLIKEKIKWGDSNAIIDLIEKIVYRKGLGGKLANGIDLFASEIGADFAMHIKGQEVPFHDPRGKKAVAISYATTPRGANHMDFTHDDIYSGMWNDITAELGIYRRVDRFSWENKAEFCKVTTDLASFTNSAIMCGIVGFDLLLACGYNAYPNIREAIYATTSLEIGVCEMLLIGERNYDMLKIAAAQQGYTRKDDDLPQRFKGPLPRGGSANESIPDAALQESIDRYYELRGFDNYGPTDEKLKQLNMKEFIGFIKRED